MKHMFIPCRAGTAICQRVIQHMDYLIEVSSQLAYTFKVLRPDETDRFLYVEYSLQKGVNTFVTIKKVMEKTITTLSKSQKPLTKKNLENFHDLLNMFEVKTTKSRKLLINHVLEFMRLELSNIFRLHGFLDFFTLWAHKLVERGSREFIRYRIFLIYYFRLGAFCKTSYLFLEVYQQLLNPHRFFVNADVIYYFTSKFFERSMLIGKVPHNARLYYLAYIFKNFENFFPPSHLLGLGPKEFVQHLEITNNTTFSKWQRTAYAFCAKFSLNQDRFTSYSLDKSNMLMNGVAITFYNRYRVLQLFTRLARDIIAKAKRTYLDLKAFVSTTLGKVFAQRELQRANDALLKRGIRLYFMNCVEVLSRCKKSIHRLQQGYEFGLRNMEEYVGDIFDLYLPYTSFDDVWMHSSKAIVHHFVAEHCNIMRINMRNRTVKFLYKYMDTMSRLGYNFADQEDSCVVLLGQAMCMYQVVNHELKHGVRAFKRTGVTPIVFRNVTVMVNKVYALYDKLDGIICALPPKSQRVRPEDIIRFVPLNKELREIVVKRMGPIFDGTELELSKMITTPFRRQAVKTPKTNRSRNK